MSAGASTSSPLWELRSRRRKVYWTALKLLQYAILVPFPDFSLLIFLNLIYSPNQVLGSLIQISQKARQ
jgi:hypothetical protein